MGEQLPLYLGHVRTLRKKISGVSRIHGCAQEIDLLIAFLGDHIAALVGLTSPSRCAPGLSGSSDQKVVADG